MLQKGAIESVQTCSPGFYSGLFVVPKASGSRRPVIDLSTLHQYIPISSTSFWPLHKPKSLHQGTEAGTGIPPRTWSSAPHVSGRLAPQPQLLSKISLPYTLADKSMLSLGLGSECGQVSVDYYPYSSLLGNPDRLPDGESLASREKDYQMVGSGSRVFGPPSPTSNHWFQVLGHLVSWEKLVPFESDLYSGNSNATGNRNQIYLLPRFLWI